MEYNAAMIEACQKTLVAYAALILDPTDNQLRRWKDYGTFEGCRLCTAADDDCSLCPLGREEEYGCLDGTHSSFYDQICTYRITNTINLQLLTRTAVDRMRWLKEHFLATGIPVESYMVPPGRILHEESGYTNMSVISPTEF